jgi:hypothetical protein
MSMRGANILSHLGDRLRVTVDGDQREKLLKLLISELDKLGRDAESWATLERHIAIGEMKIQSGHYRPKTKWSHYRRREFLADNTIGYAGFAPAPAKHNSAADLDLRGSDIGQKSRKV